MAIRGVNLSEKEEVIHPDDPGNPENPEVIEAKKAGREVEEPTIYYIGNLTANDRVELGDMVATPTMRDGGITMTLRNNEKSYAVVRRGLKGWKNQLGHDDKPVAFKTETDMSIKGKPIVVASDASMAVLPTEVIHWLSEKIQEKNGMTADLAKKSSGALPQSLDLTSLTGDAPNAPTISDENEVAANQPSEG